MQKLLLDRERKLITTLGNEKFYEFSSVESKGNFIFQSKLMQKVNPRDTDRFKFVIHLSAITVNPELHNIEAKISYAFLGKNKATTMIKKI